MKMKIATPLPADYTVQHEDLAESALVLMAHALLPLFAENMPEAAAKANVTALVTELGYLFDEGKIHLGGQVYRPRLAFVDEDGALLPGAAALTTLHALIDAPFDIAPETGISFEREELPEE